MPTAVVTGANGFIGTHLVKRLSLEGFTVRALVYRPEPVPDALRAVEVVEGDIRDPGLTAGAMHPGDWVFHLAGKVHDQAEKMESTEHDDITVGGTRNVMAAASANKPAVVIFLSSAAVYGSGSEAELDESAPCRPDTRYGLSKLKAERLVLERGSQLGIRVACLRPALVYGPGSKGNLVRMIALMRRRLFPPLPEFGNRRSLAFVDDVTEALVLAACHAQADGQCYNLTDGRCYTTREIYELVQAAIGRKPPRWHVPVTGFRILAQFGDAMARATGRRAVFDSHALSKLAGSAWFSCAKIRRELAFTPKGRLEDALPVMVSAQTAEEV